MGHLVITELKWNPFFLQFCLRLLQVTLRPGSQGNMPDATGSLLIALLRKQGDVSGTKTKEDRNLHWLLDIRRFEPEHADIPLPGCFH